MTYRAAGVDVAGAGRFVKALAPMARLTRRSGSVAGIGGFGGLFALDKGGRQLLVASADGVGTKLCLARKVGWYTPLGVDLVAMNVNDLICTGAEPLFFLDYIATGKLKPKPLMDVLRGVTRGCIESGCALLGGETAEMPLLYGPDDFDLAGFSVGRVAASRLVTGRAIRPGDAVLGLASSGPHANGFSLIQKVLSSRTLKTHGRKLLAPTRIYVGPVLGLLRAGVPLKGIAHITGGSFEEKGARILPAGVNARLDRSAWPVPSVFRLIASGGVSPAEMYRTFNMGVGMVLFLPKRAVPAAQRLLTRRGMAHWVIGEAVRGRGKVVWASRGAG
ncbi:MAG: phosphoribosylformylglycinamidine cyclo-ligase [Candidatus Omnitrophica bacterium CG11_big_fil_rev_8_21_14_0_20_64_10]|nr:MAG: phosphoribosylformylglycinamidine cyclo-ligase [Candidatus Omnitrophica bacterium CG11_big_fil_rev_8_21_14_0_20_64_10]